MVWEMGENGVVSWVDGWIDGWREGRRGEEGRGVWLVGRTVYSVLRIEVAHARKGSCDPSTSSYPTPTPTILPVGPLYLYRQYCTQRRRRLTTHSSPGILLQASVDEVQLLASSLSPLTPSASRHIPSDIIVEAAWFFFSSCSVIFSLVLFCRRQTW